MTATKQVEISWLVPGACFTIRGERGVFKVREIKNGPDGHIIESFGGTPGRQRFRAFHVDRIRAVVKPQEAVR